MRYCLINCEDNSSVYVYIQFVNTIMLLHCFALTACNMRTICQCKKVILNICTRNNTRVLGQKHIEREKEHEYFSSFSHFHFPSSNVLRLLNILKNEKKERPNNKRERKK